MTISILRLGLLQRLISNQVLEFSVPLPLISNKVTGSIVACLGVLCGTRPDSVRTE